VKPADAIGPFFFVGSRPNLMHHFLANLFMMVVVLIDDVGVVV
jgi:hypothetical protein